MSICIMGLPRFRCIFFLKSNPLSSYRISSLLGVPNRQDAERKTRKHPMPYFGRALREHKIQKPCVSLRTEH